MIRCRKNSEGSFASSISKNSRIFGFEVLFRERLPMGQKETHTSVSLFLGHARETVSRHVSCRTPLRHLWAGTYGQRLHPQGRLRTTPSAASGGCAPTLRLRCRLGVFPPQRGTTTLFHRLAGCSSTSSRLSPCPGPADGRRCGSPFFLKYVLCVTSFPTSSLAAGWVFLRGDTGSLQGTHLKPGPRFIVFFLFQGCLVESAVTGNEAVSSNKACNFLIVTRKISKSTQDEQALGSGQQVWQLQRLDEPLLSANSHAVRVVTQPGPVPGFFCWEAFRLVGCLSCPCDAVRAVAPPEPCPV